MKTKLLLLIIIALSLCVKSQYNMEYCSFDAYQNLLIQDTNYLNKKLNFEQNIYNNFIHVHPQAKSILTIPVVFHIIHNSGTENISDAMAQQAIIDLNEAFSNTGYYGNSLGVNTDIVFCFAKQNPSGTFTTGVNRVVSTLTEMTMETQDAALKSLSFWNSNLYLNIWVVKNINSLSSGPGVAGYANFPSGHGSLIDGIVVEAPSVGSSKEMSKVIIHEAGHYLGLYHTFQDGCSNSNCLLNGDRVCDTPPDNTTASNLCSILVNSCNSDVDDISSNNPFRPVGMGGIGDQNDLNTNYMDYGNFTCFNAFTSGQKDRMRYALLHERFSLTNSIACNSLCTSPTNASFTHIDTTLISGTTINFNNTSTGATTYKWTINNSFFSNLSNPSYIFNSSGRYIICLEASNGDSACTTYHYDTIFVRCNFDITITSPTTTGVLNATINFTANVIGASTINWYRDAVLEGSGTNLNIAFNNMGGFYIYAIATDGICYDTSNYIFISVGTCINRNYDRWHFGNRAALDFASGSPVPFSPSLSDMQEGSASFCYNNGRTMMYAGQTVIYDSTNTIMPNSVGLLGASLSSSTQGYLFLKKPANDSIYYVFTTDEEGGPNGFRYSEINMHLRGGLGDVTATKNVLLYSPTCEKQFAIKHCNGKKIWLLTHEWNSNRFIVYKIDENGIDTNKIISSVGSIHTGTTFSHGQLIASPNGKKVAIACQQGFIELFDFDNNTGLLSNPLRFAVPFAYGIAFSPNNNLLYATGITFGTPEVFQFNVSLGSLALITASRTIVGMAPGGTHGSLVLMRDGKIYQTNGYQPAISVINFPNLLGAACDYQSNSILLSPGVLSNAGLNNIPVTFSSSFKPALIGMDTICANTIANYDVVVCTDSTYFSIDGTAQIIYQDNHSVQLTSSVSGINTLIVKLMSECGIDFDTLKIYVKPGPQNILSDDTTLCTRPIIIESGSDAFSYLWNTSAVTSNIIINSSGTYWVKKTDTSGCIVTDTIRVHDYIAQPLNLGPDTFICPDQLVHLNATNNYTSYLWQDGLDLPIYSAYHEGLYYVMVKDICNNTFSDSILIKSSNLLNSILPNDTCILDGNSICINASTLINRTWSTGENTSSICITPNDSTIVWVNGKDTFGCFYNDTILICILNNTEEKPIIPSVFTPNNDGLNDLFMIVNYDKFNIKEFSIWNRWGAQLYHTNSNIGWNGKFNNIDQAIGTYVYYFIVQHKITNTEYKITGTISLIR